jgi:LemA protein
VQRFGLCRALVMILAAVTVSGCSDDKLAAQEQAVKEEWADIQKTLRQRDDLIPPVVETVGRYASRELPELRAAVDSRARLAAARTPAETIDAANHQSAALSQLLTLAKNHPQMQANDSFTHLMDELAGIENRIAVGRMRYNAFVQQYNTSRRRFPGTLTALLFNRRDYPFFEVPAAAGH